MENKKSAREIKVRGIVQGVGLRPHVYKLSSKYNLKGWVVNSSEGVTIHWEGSFHSIDLALEDLLQAPPPQAKINHYEAKDAVCMDYSAFFIQESHISGNIKGLITPDMGVCTDCWAEMLHKEDRRYLYPLLNCTNCGPRFTITQDVPYDRHLTTMKDFKMCPECVKEYNDPLDRRFHAQPNACSKCGPKVEITDFRGNILGSSYDIDISKLLIDGKILAVKGLGGFHLICDALNEKTIYRLRKVKERDGKPFALMAADVETVRKYCYLSSKEEEYLISPKKPIVVLEQKAELKKYLSEKINPGLDTLGIMLPYTPLHLMFFSDELKVVVATSANISSNPLITSNEEAIEKLDYVADYLVIHNRNIENPCDDSVGYVANNSWQPIRRARGYVPLPVTIDKKVQRPTLACGGNFKNTFALARSKEVFLSQHLGDMDNYLSFELYKKTISKMIKMFSIVPEVIVHDLHPDYQSTHYARELAAEIKIPTVGVQHHHAHMVSCMAENNLTEEVIAVICDGTGYGTDGTIWGFEFLTGNYRSFERLGHLSQVPLPGGEVSIKYPARMAYSFLLSTLGNKGRVHADDWLNDISKDEKKVLQLQLEKGLNSVATSSCGRLFDAVAALIGVCKVQLYEGQAPMELEALARCSPALKERYEIIIEETHSGKFKLNTTSLWEEIIFDMSKHRRTQEIAYKFHEGIARAINNAVNYMSKNTGLQDVVLSGGVFQNRLLTDLTMNLLKESNLRIYYHKQVPANDGGISLGQAVAGNEVYENVSSSTF